jgi:hypothetical protein
VVAVILAWAAVAVIAILAAIACAIWGHVRYKDGYEAGTLDAQSKANLKRLRGRSALLGPPGVPAQFRRQPEPWFPAVTAVTPRYAVSSPRLGPGTVPIMHVPSDTGGFKAATDQYIAQLEADGEAFRRQLRQEINA